MAQSPPVLEDLSSFENDLLQHSAGVQYVPDGYSQDQHGYIHSGTNSGYMTPDPNQMLEQHGSPYMNQYTNQYEPGPGIGADLYGNPIYYQQQRQEYYPAASNQYPSPVHYQYTNTTSPPTPSASDLSSSGKRKRPNRSHAANSSASPASSAPRAKKAKLARSEKAKTPKLNAPLSVLTKDSDVPLKDMEAWVNRSAEERLKEVENRPKNKITRPMNSFMLYRSAYADRTKRWCTQNNHQVVSSVSGESWPMEPADVREMYTEYARIERDNHQKAHPGYKFSPTKPGSAARKRKDNSEDEASDLESIDGEYMPSGRSRSRRPRQAALDAGWSGGYSNHYAHQQPRAIPNNSSSYQFNNPNKPLPAPMVDHGVYGQYYQTVVQSKDVNTEDVLYQRMQVPGGVSYGTAQALSSVPGGPHHELLKDDFAESPASLEAATFDDTLDPSLTNEYGDSDSVFDTQAASGQDNGNANLQTYAQSGTATHDPALEEWDALGDDADYNLSDNAMADIFREANGSS